MAKSKVQITLDDDLLVAVDDYCDKNYMNRSWLISQALMNVLNQQKMIDALVDVSVAMKKISESNEVDDETMQQLATFEAMCKLVVGRK